MGDTVKLIAVDDGAAGFDRLIDALTSSGMSVLRQPSALLETVGDDVEGLVLGPKNSVEALAALDHLPRARELPLLLFVAGDDSAVRARALRDGFDDVLDGSMSPDEWVARIARSLRAQRRVATLAKEAAVLERLSITDSLTQLYNRRFFQDRLREEFRRAQRYDDPVALIMLDLDHFKSINDKHGHPFGDQVLKSVGDSLRASVRETDIVCRFGGEEFACILPKTHLAGGLTVAERIWKGFGAMKISAGVKVTASLGLAGYPGRMILSADQLVRAADEALYAAKRGGRNRICLHSPHGDESTAKTG